MRCDEASELLDAFSDGELDSERSAQVRDHVAGCALCGARLDDRRALREALSDRDLYHRAPESLREALAHGRMQKADGSRPARPRAPVWAWGSLAACAVLAGAVIWLAAGVFGNAAAANGDVREAVSSHIRSLMGSHLLDIATSDRHTVKPWFAGKVDFAPRVPDFAAEGFPLAGGRLDYVAGRPVAAVVYNRRAHIINLFMCPDPSGRALEPRLVEDRGYHGSTWSDGSMRLCAVSDVSEDELMTFVRLVRSDANREPPRDGP